MRKPKFDCLKCQRQILVDMHVPDWDPRIPCTFDPQHMADLYEKLGAQAVMHYCKLSHGTMMLALLRRRNEQTTEGRDVAGKTVTELPRRGVPM
jgi:hypothetical protein